MHRTADGKIDRVVEVGVGKGGDEALGSPRRVGPDQDRVEHQGGVVALFVSEGVLSGYGSHDLLEEFEVVIGVALPGRNMAVFLHAGREGGRRREGGREGGEALKPVTPRVLEDGVPWAPDPSQGVSAVTPFNELPYPEHPRDWPYDGAPTEPNGHGGYAGFDEESK